MIPISLYVSIEIVKICQVYFIHQDKDLYDEETDSQLQCRALNITEDLGQVQFIFSDKTGTLTENKMVFRRCTVSGIEYSHDDNGELMILFSIYQLYFGQSEVDRVNTLKSRIKARNCMYPLTKLCNHCFQVSII